MVVVEMDEMESSDNAFGFWLKADTAKAAKALHFQTALKPGGGGGAAAAEAACRMEVVVGSDQFDTTGVDFSETSDRLSVEILLPKKDARPKPLRVQLKRVGQEP